MKINESQLTADVTLIRDAARRIEETLGERLQPQDQTAAQVGAVRNGLDEILAMFAEPPSTIAAPTVRSRGVKKGRVKARKKR